MHNFLFLDDERVESILAGAATDPRIGRGLTEIEREADSYLAQCDTLASLPAGEFAGKGFARPYDRMLTVLGFFARIHQRDRRYTHAARTVLDVLARTEAWEATWTDRVPNWRATLASAGNALAFSLALNWLGESLAASERERYAHILFEKGIRPLMEDWLWPGTRIHSLDSMGHNFYACSVASAGAAALLSTQYCDEARSCAADVHSAILEWFEYPGNTLQNKVANFGYDGGYFESLSYSLVLKTVLQFSHAYRSIHGECDIESVPHWAGVIDYYIHGSYDTSNGLLGLNFGDHVTADWIGKTGEIFHCVLLRLATLSGDGRAQWLADKTRSFAPEPFAIIWRDDAIAPVSPTSLPLSRLFRGIGWAVCRDTWDQDATLFAIKSGVTWNHDHADAGSFVLWSGGQPLIVDAGSLNYPRREYINYFCQPWGHNIVMVDGQSQPVEDIYRGSRTPGGIPVLVDTRAYRYVLADASGPTSGVFQRNFRHLIWVDGSLVLMDDLLSRRVGQFEWLFHPAGEVDIPGGSIEPGQARQMGRKSDCGIPDVHIRKEGACVRLACVWPALFDCEAKEGFVEQDRGLSPDIAPARTVYYALKSRADHRTRTAGELAFKTEGVEGALDATGREQKYVVILTPYQAGRERDLPVVAPVEAENIKGVSLMRDSASTEVLFNLLADGRVMHQNSIVTYGALTTDASLLTVCRDSAAGGSWREDIIGLRIHNGSMLRLSGRPIVETGLKAEFVVDQVPRGLHVYIVSRAGFRVGIGCPGKPSAVSASVAGAQPEVVRYDRDRAILDLRLTADTTDLSIEW